MGLGNFIHANGERQKTLSINGIINKRAPLTDFVYLFSFGLLLLISLLF